MTPCHDSKEPDFKSFSSSSKPMHDGLPLPSSHLGSFEIQNIGLVQSSQVSDIGVGFLRTMGMMYVDICFETYINV